MKGLPLARSSPIVVVGAPASGVEISSPARPSASPSKTTLTLSSSSSSSIRLARITSSATIPPTLDSSSEHPPPPGPLSALLRACGFQPDLFPLRPLEMCLGRLSSRLLHDALRGLCGRLLGLWRGFLEPPQPCWRDGVGAPRKPDVRGLNVAMVLQVL